MLNDYSSLNLTKLDVLDHLDEIKIAVEYRLNGKKLDSMPSSLEDLRNVEVIYETVSGYFILIFFEFFFSFHIKKKMETRHFESQKI